MQITSSTRNGIGGAKKKGYREVKDSLISLEQEDLNDPIVNIAMGTRWLTHKYSKIRNLPEKTTFTMLKRYNEDNYKGEAYARKVLELCQKKF